VTIVEKKSRQSFGGIALLLLGVLIGLIFLFPIYIMLMTSIKPVTQIFDLKLIPDTAVFSNYVEIFQKYDFTRCIRNSLIVAVVTTCLSLFMQSTSAYALSRLRFRGKNAVFFLVISTMMVPFSVLIIPLFLIAKALHLTNTLAGIIIPIAANGYGVYLLRQFFFGIPRDMDESAFIDGAGYFQIFFRILLPLCKPILITLATCYFLYNWNNYLWPIIVTTKKELWLVQAGIAGFRSERTVEWNLVFAASVVTSVPLFLLFAFFQKFLVEGIKTTGIK